MLTDVDPDAGIVRALFRIPEYDRVQGRVVPLAPRSVAEGSTVYPSSRDGNLDVCPVMDQSAICSTESSGEDNGVCLPRDDGVFLLASRSRAESVLCSAEHCDASTAMAHCA